MSVCITLRNRAKYMAVKLSELLQMNYDPKELEICVTDGGSTDGLVPLLKAYAGKFLQIKYAKSDRSRLPFRIPYNNPACDVNAQICNVATFNTIIRTDAEVRFGSPDSLTYIARVMAQYGKNRKALSFGCRRLKDGYQDVPNFGARHPAAFVDRRSVQAFFCVVFDRRDFIRMGGIEETFALGFAAEDTHWHWYQKLKKRLLCAPKDQDVYHVWHGAPREAPGARRLWREYTMPLYSRMKRYKIKPNIGNPYWKRKEMISEAQIWRA